MERNDWGRYFSAVKAGKWNDALGILQHISTLEQDNPKIFLLIGDIFRRTGDTNNAVSSYMKVASLLRERGAEHGSLSLYKLILEIDPGNSPALKEVTALLGGEQDMGGSAFSVRDEDTSKTDGTAGAITSPKEKYEVRPEKPSPPKSVHEKGPPADEAKAHTVGASSADAGTTIDRDEGEPDLTSTDVPPEDQPESVDELHDLLRPLDQRYDAPGEAEIFAGVPEDEVMNILKELDLLKFRKSEYVLKEGELGDSVYLIKSGKARVTAHILGREIELSVLHPGEIFGEVGFLAGRPRTASVIAAEPLEAYEITRTTLEQIIEFNPGILSRIEEFYESRAQDTIRKIRE